MRISEGRGFRLRDSEATDLVGDGLDAGKTSSLLGEVDVVLLSRGLIDLAGRSLVAASARIS